MNVQCPSRSSAVIARAAGRFEAAPAVANSASNRVDLPLP
jgi:hypothetical protein